MRIIIDGKEVQAKMVDIRYDHVEDGELAYSFGTDHIGISVFENGKIVFDKKSTLQDEVDNVVQLME